ncbi:hypothetical protein [Aeoliella sp. SH292]|uniref:hypothetical protein n=1 Tax=Aeoliella sp. SH292 TaxID=3454464 RepID=UPI003F94D9FF
MQRELRRFHYHGICYWHIALVALALTVGCEKNDGRVHLSGPVTWKGQPVPEGYVLFNPDVAAGNIGPQGMAPISNGRYDTRAEGGRPIPPGALVVSIAGFDGQNRSEDQSRGNRMFMPAEVKVNAPAEGGELELVVPETAEALK